MPRLRAKERRRPIANSPMRKWVDRQPKGESKPAKALRKVNKVSARGCEGGSGLNRLTLKKPRSPAGLIARKIGTERKSKWFETFQSMATTAIGKSRKM
jgi:hypothetical protein